MRLQFEGGDTRPILGRVPCHQAEALPRFLFVYKGVSPTVIFEVPAVKAPATVLFNSLGPELRMRNHCVMPKLPRGLAVRYRWLRESGALRGVN